MLNRLFRRRPKTYILFLARRGRPLEIEKIVARNIEEALEEARAIIDDLDPEEIPELKQYKSFILISEDEKERKRIRNPYARKKGGGEEEEIDLETEAEKLMLATLINKIPDLMSKTIDAAVLPVADSLTLIQRKIMEKQIEIITRQLEQLMPPSREEIEKQQIMAMLMQVIPILLQDPERITRIINALKGQGNTGRGDGGGEG